MSSQDAWVAGEARRQDAGRPRQPGQGVPAAPERHSLALLPSGPDAVRRLPPRRTLAELPGPSSRGPSTRTTKVDGRAARPDSSGGQDGGQSRHPCPRAARHARLNLTQTLRSERCSIGCKVGGSDDSPAAVWGFAARGAATSFGRGVLPGPVPARGLSMPAPARPCQPASPCRRRRARGLTGSHCMPKRSMALVRIHEVASSGESVTDSRSRSS